MAGPVASDFYLLQQNGKPIAGNLAAMPATHRHGGIAAHPAATGNHDVLGVGAFLAPGLYVFSGSDTARLRTVQTHILHVMLGLFAAAMLLAVAGGTLVSWSFLRRTDAMARACRDIMDGDLKLRIPVRGTRRRARPAGRGHQRDAVAHRPADGQSLPGQQRHRP